MNIHDKYKFIPSLALISIALSIIFAGLYILNCQFNETTNQSQPYMDLYPVDKDDKIIYIDENGKEIFSLDTDKWDYFFGFHEGILILANEIKNFKSEDDYYALYHLALCNTEGNIINELPYYAKLNISFATDSPYESIFFNNGYAKITYVDDLNSKIEHIVYIDKNGNEVNSNIGKVCEEIANKSCNMSSECPYANSIYQMDDEPLTIISKCKQDKNKECFEYVSKANSFLTNSDASCLQSDDMTRDPHFYNGIAMYFISVKDDCVRRFINTKGEFINDEIYDIAEPFYKNLAFVTIGYKHGYINRKGKWVYAYKGNISYGKIIKGHE